MKLIYAENVEEIDVPELISDDMSINSQQKLLELAGCSARYDLTQITVTMSTISNELAGWVYSILLHFLPSETNLNDIIGALEGLSSSRILENRNSDVPNPQFTALLKFINHQNHRLGFSEHTRTGFIKAKIRMLSAYTRPESIQLYIKNLNISEGEHKEVCHWFDLNVAPSAYFQISVQQWERIANLNKLNEFYEVTRERCKSTVGEGVFYHFLKEAPSAEMKKFNDNDFTNLFDTQFELIGNIYVTLINTHEENDSFVQRLLEIIQGHKHDSQSLAFSLQLLDDLKLKTSEISAFKELLKLAELLKIYDLNSIDQIKESETLQEEILEQSLWSDSLNRLKMRQLLDLRMTLFHLITEEKFHQEILNSLLSQQRFDLISEIPNNKRYESILVSKFWFYFKHEFNNCYKILDYLPDIYTSFLSSISSLPGIQPGELLTSSPQDILERLFQLNPGEYRHHSKYHKILDLIATLIPTLQITDFKVREVAIEYGLIENDFDFIIIECFELLNTEEKDSNDADLWLIIYKVTKIITINYATGEITDISLAQKNLQLLSKLMKVVPTSNIHDVIENFLKLKELITMNAEDQ